MKNMISFLKLVGWDGVGSVVIWGWGFGRRDFSLLGLGLECSDDAFPVPFIEVFSSSIMSSSYLSNLSSIISCLRPLLSLYSLKRL